MRKILIALAATVFATGAANAAQFNAIVAEIDHETRMVMLEDGRQLTIVESADHQDIAAGDNVTLTVDDTSGEVTDIYPVE
jgi:FKBP-type peptidyl-prolyl cis-trans isomerase